MPRHGSEDIYVNDKEFYEEFIEKRGLDRLTQYRTPKFPPITTAIRRRFRTIRYIWKQGDKYYKVANEFYGDPRLWWILAWFNQKPNEGLLKPGAVLYIPQPLSKILTFFNFGSI